MRKLLDCTNSLATFSLQEEAQRKSYKNETPSRGISPSAEGDQRPTALDPCHHLKKVDENFHQTDEIRLFRLQSGAADAFRIGGFRV